MLVTNQQCYRDFCLWESGENGLSRSLSNLTPSNDQIDTLSFRPLRPTFQPNNQQGTI